MGGPARGGVTYVDARVRIRHPCPYCDLSAAFPDVSMASWCNQAYDVLQVTVPDPSDLPSVLAALERSLGSREVTREGASALTITRACRWDQFPSVTAVADRCDVWLIPPITYLGGWETHQLLAPNPERFAAFAKGVQALGEIEILSTRTKERFDVVRDLGVLPVRVLDGLTERQVHILASACENGLLDVPSRGRIGDAARREGISRSTYSEHLRKAQSRVARNVYPLLKLRDHGAARRGASRDMVREGDRPPTVNVRSEAPPDSKRFLKARRA